MNASDLTQRLRQRTVAAWQHSNPQQADHERSEGERKQRVVGNQSFFMNSLQLDSGSNRDDIRNLTFTIADLLLESHDAYLEYQATQNFGPTRCARLNYIWFATAAMAYNWTVSGTTISGTKDGWNWDEHHPLEKTYDRCIWFTHALCHYMPLFYPAYRTDRVLEAERARFNWTEGEQRAEAARVQTAGDWSSWTAAWAAWITHRASDGNVEAAAPPSISELPNGEQTLKVDLTEDPATFPQPTKWTPLVVDGRTQRYLTHKWNDVRSTGLDAAAEAAIKSAGDAYFVTDPSSRAAEIDEVVTIIANLTDAQKVSAEFWAGGPNTVSPPGMCIWFWKEFVRSQERIADETVVFSGLDLAIHIFETSRVVWGLKRDHMEARPIQEIRRMYRGQTLTGYNGLPVTGESWVPYQESDFVSPPFADFPSGHSAFSQSFANVMTAWFGPVIPTTRPRKRTDTRLLTPALSTAQINPFGTFVFPAGVSQIQAGVPAAAVALSWPTWQEMANDAGISRKFGGIHATSAHLGSQAAANALHHHLKSLWGIRGSKQ
jgi:hypothetical protein